MDKRNIATTVQCFVKKDGKYLMLRRNTQKRIMPGVWMAPGGHRDFSEGLFDAARREIKEETGLEIKNICIRATGIAYLKDLDQELYFHLLTAEHAGGTLKQNPEDGELVWLTPDEVLTRDNLLAEIHEVFSHVIGEDPRVISYRAIYDKGNSMVQFRIEDP